MSGPAPAWEHRSDRTLSQGYGHVRFCDEHVLGQWFGLDRGSGRLLWQGDGHGMDEVGGYGGGIAITSRMVSSGPSTYSTGCKALRVATGEVAWTAAPPEPRGLLARLLRLFIAAEESVSFVEGGEVYCGSGRVLDLQTGRELRRIGSDELRALSDAFRAAGREGDARQFYWSVPVTFGGGRLRRGTPEAPVPANSFDRSLPLAFFLEREDGTVAWRFELDPALEIDGNFYSYRWLPPVVVAVASLRADAGNRERNFRLIEVDARTGLACADVALGDGPAIGCRIEDADGTDLLVSGRSGEVRWLRCYRHEQA